MYIAKAIKHIFIAHSLLVFAIFRFDGGALLFHSHP